MPHALALRSDASQESDLSWTLVRAIRKTFSCAVEVAIVLDSLSFGVAGVFVPFVLQFVHVLPQFVDFLSLLSWQRLQHLEEF